MQTNPILKGFEGVGLLVVALLGAIVTCATVAFAITLYVAVFIARITFKLTYYLLPLAFLVLIGVVAYKVWLL